MLLNTEYRCPSCRERAQVISCGPQNGQNNNRARIGVIHAPTCQLFKMIKADYPKLVERIEKERSPV